MESIDPIDIHDESNASTRVHFCRCNQMWFNTLSGEGTAVDKLIEALKQGDQIGRIYAQ
jgi:hypothetical protein